MGSTARTIAITGSVPDDDDQDHEVERRRLWDEVQRRVDEIVRDPRYADLLLIRG